MPSSSDARPTATHGDGLRQRVGWGRLLGFRSPHQPGSVWAAHRSGAFGLGAIFSLGWTPCIGPTLGAILGLSAIGPSVQVVALFAAYSLGLAVPFLAMALALERSRALTAPLLRHGRLVDLVGGLLVAGIGLAILFDWLSVLASTFSFLTPSI